MKVELADILSCENREMSEQVEIELLSFDSKLGQFPIVRKAPFVMKFTNEENRRLFIQGETEITIAIPCDRCLEQVERAFSVVIEKEIPLEKGSPEAAIAGVSGLPLCHIYGSSRSSVPCWAYSAKRSWVTGMAHRRT